jgi:hypothetical protein
MTGTRNFFQKRAGWMSVYLTLIVMATNVSALEMPGFKPLGIPGFKYGKIKRDGETNRIFQTYTIMQDHRYYTSGRGNIPNAIIGVQSKYKLRPGLWQEVSLTTPMLRGWVSQMDNIYGYPPYGSAILDHKGKQIGIWYSSKQWTTVIIEENNEVAILAPEPPGFRGGQ